MTKMVEFNPKKMSDHLAAQYRQKVIVVGPVRKYQVNLKLPDDLYWGFPIISFTREPVIDMVYLGEVAGELDPQIEEIAASVILLLGPNELTQEMAEAQYDALMLLILRSAKLVHQCDDELQTAIVAQELWPHKKLSNLIKTLKKGKK